MEIKPFQELLQREHTVLVDFFASWCSPCQTLSPVVEDFAGTMNNKVRVIKVDVDKNRETALTYNIRSVPTLILFKNGEMVWRKTGLLTRRDLTLRVKEHLD